MAKNFLKTSRLDQFLETLRLFGELHAPTISESGVHGFAPLDDPADLNLDYRRTQIPPKKYLLPFREEILQCAGGKYREGNSGAGDMVLFGVHSCDLEGIAYLDRVFLSDPVDPGYSARRARLTLVGISCVPDDYCFCPEEMTSTACDLFLGASAEGFHLSCYSTRGRALLAAAEHLLEEGAPLPAATCSGPCFPPQDPDLRFSDHPLWQKFASTCVSCGACSVCCPTCYCFDVREYPGLAGGGTRIREWDNCLFATHGEVAGANFRPDRLDRLRYRFLHKYCGFTPLQGTSSCVGCGRCKAVCPVDIDLRELTVAPKRVQP
ncbi:4Fe-4S dicluster domain-containing protein [Geomonas paludis]|uniref:4Fe-4S dicluster domain-containing protein n=1 Tax=Geomonas paludis TaxID=2740185 RepID=A0A6V8MX83_9BACT|nr:4Fe-4S dicluster domain-containing protein [Geomonas paludis]UPU34177.1 4Fe-4S dicluster domain-containing protein [Geomonas paludis]GFO64153.1 4Fe-4S ferredoxin [Geomonas paludis]